MRRVIDASTATREPYRPQGIPLSLKHIEPRYTTKSRWRHSRINGSQHNEIVTGEISKGLPGSKNVVCMERDARNLGGSILKVLLVKQVGLPNRKRRMTEADRSSD